MLQYLFLYVLYSYLEILVQLSYQICRCGLSNEKNVNEMSSEAFIQKNYFISVVTATMILDSWMFLKQFCSSRYKYSHKLNKPNPLWVVPVIWEFKTSLGNTDLGDGGPTTE